jgi:hypothetical protein
MIASIQPEPAGNAIHVILAPPAEAAQWRLLRRGTDAFTGPDDPDAVVAGDWGDWIAVMDDVGLTNGRPYFYRAYYRDAAGFNLPPSPTVQATPVYAASDPGPNPLRLLHDRLRVGLRNMIDAGQLRVSNGKVAIVTAPFMSPDKTTFPIISLHMESDRPSDQAIGAFAAGGAIGDEWEDATGWWSDVTINCLALSLNPDERIALGEAIKHVVIASLPIFEANGLIRPLLSLTHSELAPEASGAPLYVAAATFTCQAPSFAFGRASVVTDTLSTITEPA